MRKILSLFLILVLLTGAAPAETSALGVECFSDPVRPGKAAVIAVTLPAAGTITLTAETPEGEVLAVIADGTQAGAGTSYLWWNGTHEGVLLVPGEAVLKLASGGGTAACPLTIGEPAPFITAVAADRTALTADEPELHLTGVLSGGGVLHAELTLITESEQFTLIERDLEADALNLTIAITDAFGETLAGGEYRLDVTLRAGNDVSDPVSLSFTVNNAGAALPENGELLAEEEIPPEAADDTVDAEEPLPETADDTAGEPEALPGETEAADVAAEGDGVITMEALPEEADSGVAPEALPEETEVIEHVSLDEPGEPAADPSGVTLTAENPVWLQNNDQRQYTPAHGSPYEGQDTSFNYWTMPMDITDEDAVWAMLTSPITVVDNGKKNAQRSQVTIRREPDANSEGVGVVTCISQGVHVLDIRGDWALIECYSSSFHDSSIKAWNMLVQGWIPAGYLKTVTPNQEMGIVVDKLTQRMYIFKDGRLYDTLLVSTGKVNAKQPYNETRSGEFLLMVPAVGGFQDGSMICSMAIRFNGGDLLHEVPHSENKNGEKYYGTFEPSLGTKASHGCIRVQRRRTPQGVNMAWIWSNKKNNTRIVIWEDWQGRQVSPPSPDTVIYYNPKGGSMYHSCETCYSAKGKTFTAFTYGELDDPAYAKLTCCPWCNPPLRLKDIAAINQEYLPGGNHNPQLTEAREKQGFIEVTR